MHEHRSKSLLALLLMLAACDREPGPNVEQMARQAPSAADLAETDANSDAAPSNSAVAALREHTLELPVRDAPAQRIAFGRKRLAQLGQDELVVRTTSDFAVVARAPMRVPRAVVELADGSLLAADDDALHHLEVNAKTLKRYPRAVLFPGSLLLADRKHALNIWILHTAKPSLYHHALEESASLLLPLGDVFDLGPMVRGGFTAMKDGSFLYASESELSRVFPGGKKVTFKLPARGAKIQRLLTTRRIDQAWSVWSNGLMELLQVAPQFSAIRNFSLPSNVYDIACSDRHIALLRWERQATAPRRWTLEILDGNAKPLRSFELPAELAPGHGVDWVQVVTRNRALVVSNREPVVAVGGVTSLKVWNIETGKELYSQRN
jgi:hypothetical protein